MGDKTSPEGFSWLSSSPCRGQSEALSLTLLVAYVLPMCPLINSARLSNASHATAAAGAGEHWRTAGRSGLWCKGIVYTVYSVYTWACSGTQVYSLCLLCSPDVHITNTLPPLDMSFIVFKCRYNGQKLNIPWIWSQLSSHGRKRRLFPYTIEGMTDWQAKVRGGSVCVLSVLTTGRHFNSFVISRDCHKAI